MELHQLRYFVAVAETGNFTRAARRCFVSQPSLSQQILKLEDELGQRLFDRLGRRAELTAAGRAFYERARRILLEVDDAARVVREESVDGRLRLGVLPSMGPYLLPGLLARARKELPNTEFEVLEDFRTTLIEEIVAGRLDLAIASLPPDRPDVEIEQLFTEPLLVVMRDDHELATKSGIRMKDLKGQRLVLLGEASSLGLQTRRFFGDNKLEVSVACRCAQVQTAKTLVAAGIGLAILPHMASGLEYPGLVYRALQDAQPQREIVLMRNRLRFEGRTEQRFREVLHAFCAQRNRPAA